ncbi:hypothetical protein SAMN05216337_101537 [Bradyrhizobium brasilense]|uniref:Uncharacterized protein n=1 Tax=Bradyrhizobium brasilense TaxID=1419277 RepID=A0A1G6XH91_9BRAD|nr:hypothetical protein SAMN05216337_101537 [Bradyrhizobium brasilense]
MQRLVHMMMLVPPLHRHPDRCKNIVHMIRIAGVRLALVCQMGRPNEIREKTNRAISHNIAQIADDRPDDDIVFSDR